MKPLLPTALALMGLGGGLAAGHVLRPAEHPPSDAIAAERPPQPSAGVPEPAHDPDEQRDYVKLDRQFVVPLLQSNQMEGLVILSLSLEIERGTSDDVFEREPKLRDRLLQAMFLHAQSGAFGGVFTAGPAMRDLRGSLLEAARSVVGPVVHDVLVTDILRQDL